MQYHITKLGAVALCKASGKCTEAPAAKHFFSEAAAKYQVALAAGAPPPEPTPLGLLWEVTSEPLNPYTTMVGDRFMDEFSNVYEAVQVDSMFPSGDTAKKLPTVSGPLVHLKQVSLSGAFLSVTSVYCGFFLHEGEAGFAPKELRIYKRSERAVGGSTIPGSYTHGALQTFPEGITAYEDAAIGRVHASFPAFGVTTVFFVIPGVKRLTDRKLIKIGRHLWAFSGADPHIYENVSAAQKLLWARQHCARYASIRVERRGSNVDLYHTLATSSGHGIGTVRKLVI